MQHLLDFIYDHALEDRVFLLAVARSGQQLELSWYRCQEPDFWYLREPGSVGTERIRREELLRVLRIRDVPLEPLQRELESLVTTQIVYADIVLSDARRELGRDLVRRALITHRDFIGRLNRTIEDLRRTPLTAIPGGGATTDARRGHLTLIA